MAGHSKWANIQHRKNRQDDRKSRLWTKIIREITIAAKNGGPDPDTNPQLRSSLEKASNANIPKENINRAIYKGSKESDTVKYEEIYYEGYGINGSAIIAHAMTDNRTKTASEVRHIFTKNNGSLGQDGSVSFMFKKYGRFIFPPGHNTEKIFETALNFNIEEIETLEDTSTEVLCNIEYCTELYNYFKSTFNELKFSNDIIMKPLSLVHLNQEESIKMNKLLLDLENLEDIQSTYTNAILTI
ncbi:MAG: YebC/PmpR family DNA-binding transcriptional regulator [Candidatus Kinetoplastibacterium crithidii]|nr:MAG: YebC/PmpR family DNA-binding transcriptional regulator [Candidatus Kinetoplastibacterium crithidii]